MDSKKRRIYIKEILEKNDEPQKGHILAEKLGVTRQIIVKDIAILRAEGKDIIATPDGYLIPKAEKNLIKAVIAVSHETSEIEDELKTIVKFGGKVQDVIVEHPLYGEIKSMLMIKNLYDVENFINKIEQYKAEPLLILTGGVHLHTIVAENDDIIKNIKRELKEKKYMISD
ncbi:MULTISPECIES: transcription repressor NadR [Clostridium]|uniref:Putative transcription repressor NiaR n=1 Tax=Clostridium ragsdalei P11 TaxID=1353534 RepID=A0A1A6AU41_9CLOT|nr:MULTISPECIES: transcription repressor NadR [Clostridium]OBR93545.1 putative transcription repressor NiaR [Clostridium ragsdalei P11]QXE19292.1 transcription repressor NadR [Clostridium sp. 001]